MTVSRSGPDLTADDRTATAPGRPDDTAWVLVVLRHGAIEEHALPVDRPLRVGREEGVEIRINHRSISRVHASIEIVDGEVRVTDLESRNGTTIGRRRLGREPHPIAAGATIMFGDISCHLMIARTSELRSELRVEPDELDRRLAHEAERALRHEHTVSLLAVQIEPCDPQVLQRVLRSIVHQLRDLDVYAQRTANRIDVMLVETGRDAARAEAERLLAAVGASGPATRIGVACFPGDAPSVSLLPQAAANATEGASSGVHVAGEAVRVLRFGELEVVVADPAMHRVFGLVERVAPSELGVLIRGETGTGKEVIAHALHALGPRRRQPLVAINCAALPDNLLESELFGHERGAFSGAATTKQGLFEQADGGTLFLDEIGEMPAPLQAKLLRVLETKRIRRVGGVTEIPVDIRLVSATHRDLDQQVANNEFRHDLLFRLRGLEIVLPPLRQRPHELALLAQRFLAEACRAANRAPLAISAGAMAVLEAHVWSGNIRELRHAMSSAAVVADGEVLHATDLPEAIRGRAKEAPPSSAVAADLGAMSLDEAVRAFERSRIERALEASGGNQSQAARILGIPRKTLVSKLKALGLRRDGE